MPLLQEIRSCTACKDVLPLEPRPVLNFLKESKIMLIGQAPGTRVHETGIPWNDPSGERLREWLGIDKVQFYDVKNIAIVPMAFCYPGRGKSGDLPPRPECAELWMQKILKSLPNIKLTILVGQYSQRYFLQNRMKKSLTETVRNWQEYTPDYLVLPHPSPRNNIWLKKNPWFEQECIPYFKKLIQDTL